MKDIPVNFVVGKTLAEAYEEALLKLYLRHCYFKTQYDKEGFDPSIDCTMNITVLEPETDPMIHRAFQGGIEDLANYLLELEGHKDHLCRAVNDKEDTRWFYTYHNRMYHWGTWYIKDGSGEKRLIDYEGNIDNEAQGIDQVDYVIHRLLEEPETRQAQIITWIPFLDQYVYDPPCLKNINLRILEEDGIWYLNTNIGIRSNDAWNANFMNMFGLTLFIKRNIADKLTFLSGKTVKMGRLNWHADSFHVYGKDLKDFKERFIDRIAKTSFNDRVYNFKDDYIQEMFCEGFKKSLESIQR